MGRYGALSGSEAAPDCRPAQQQPPDRRRQWLAHGVILVLGATVAVETALLVRSGRNPADPVALTVFDRSAAPERRTVRAAGGLVRGLRHDKGGWRFLGLPYGRPPVGELRFAPPQPAAPWHGVLEAASFRPKCIDTHGEGEEDCLYLNVFTPWAGVNGSALLPVMLWFTGGCFMYGGSRSYDGSELIAASPNPVVVVTFEHRLGALGYMGSEALRGRGGDNATGNYATQDQRLAMSWIRDNIAAFGGDPARVTLFGQSSGAASIAVHMVAPRSAGLFHSAILESGSYANWISYSMQAAEGNYGRVLERIGCGGLNGSDAVSCMLGTDARSMQLAGEVSFHDVGCRDGCAWAPVIDGAELADEPWLLLRRGHFNEVPVLHGSCAHDGRDFVNDVTRLPQNSGVAGFIAWAEAAFGYLPAAAKLQPPESSGSFPNITAALLDIYAPEVQAGPLRPQTGQAPHGWPEQGWNQSAAEVETDFAYRCPARRTSADIARAGVPAWEYVFMHLAPGHHFADHGCELPYVWHRPLALRTPADRALSEKVITYWTNFAATHNPNVAPSGTARSSPLPEWPRADGHTVLRFDDGPAAPWPRAADARCDLWDARWAVYGRCLPEPPHALRTLGPAGHERPGGWGAGRAQARTWEFSHILFAPP
eukprot:TRINITY_DN71228_c0_g1_i1.p1 TRINITY_DN71228_c0_g1~~TRINITY_DN71228_c0_g1_i1.p1  ORF type:complete len:674 (+),score=217.57 TRINITY_DN71228_c0_g1_i1:65-2023(+)